MPTAAALPIAPDDLAVLRRWACASQLPAVLVKRAKILLLAAEGIANTEAAERVGVTRQTVLACRRRYRQGGLDGLPDRPRSGRPQTVRRTRRAEILAATLNPPPARLGITHWSTRLLANELGVGRDTVAPDLAGVSNPAVAGRDVQVLHRPRPSRQGQRCGRAVPAATRAGGGAVCG
jgi:transposase